MARTARKRHLRHGRYSRLRRSKDFLAFLAQEQTDLATTGAAVTVTLAGGTAASGTLTLAANPSADDTMTLGAKTYRFKRGFGTAAVLTLGANPTDNDTLTLGGKVYRFKDTMDAINDVKIGANAAATIVSLVRAVAAVTGSGSDWFAGTTANVDVTAADGTGDTVDITAIVSNVTLAETFTSGSNTLDVTEISSNAAINDILIGANAAATIVSIVRGVTAGAGAGTDYFTGTTANASVTAADGTGDTVTITALADGVAGNLIATTETFTNAGNVFGAALLSGGVDLSVFTATAHGYDIGEGPFVITAATTLPAGYTAAELLWVKTVPTANTFTLAPERGSQILKTFTDDGTGTLTLTKADTEKAVFEILKQTNATVLAAATDIDAI